MGDYQVVLSHLKDRNWPLFGTPIQINDGETTNQDFTFTYGSLQVDSVPPHALLSWPLGDDVEGQQTNAPFTIRSRSGAITFTARLPHYFDAIRTNYFYPLSDKDTNHLKIRLLPKLVPIAGLSWTNSLGMVFRWVESKSLWACEVETRVADYLAFTQDPDSHYDPLPKLFSVTSNGWEQLGYSWDHPGPAFLQSTNHPVIGVSWRDATNFCDWPTKRERMRNPEVAHLDNDQRYRLPTTNEWFALAGGRTFPWDGEQVRTNGNFAGIEASLSNWPAAWPVLTNHHDRFPRTAPVFSPEFAPSESRFYHLGGNAAEWCAEQVLCGGSWFDGESDENGHPHTTLLTPAADPTERHDRNGFRVFLEDIPSPPGNTK